MKKFFAAAVAVLLLMFSAVTPAFAEEEEIFSQETLDYYAGLGLQGTTLNVYNWGEYIDDEELDVISEFERVTGCDVNYTTFESNENMYSKLSGGGVSYDVIVPSDYMVERLMVENMLEKLDYANIPNYEKYFDAEQYGYLVNAEVGGEQIKDYGVIYNVGTTILIYNTKYVKEKPTSWDVLWDEQYEGRVLMFNNPRDTFAIAQALLGQDFNTENKEDWKAAADLLKEQRKTVKPEYVMDEVFDKMESGDYALATYYAGDYELMKANNPDLDFAFPKEGVNTFYDAMCIPKGSENKKGAEAFINFMLEPEVALANAEYIYYATPNKAVRENEDYSLIDSEAVYPTADLTTQEFHHVSDETIQYMNELFLEVKSEDNSVMFYAVFAAVIAVVIAVIIITVVRKKKMQKRHEV